MSKVLYLWLIEKKRNEIVVFLSMSNLRFGLIGQSLQHSFSQQFFTDFFLKNDIDGSYDNLEFQSIDSLQSFFKEAVYNYNGLNVTIPYKAAVIPFLDQIDEEAKRIGAVNTIKVVSGRLIGYNTDVFGFRQSIKPFLTNKHEKAMVIGTGGASKAIDFVLKKIGLDVLFISRHSKDSDNIFTYEEINNYMVDACKLVVNCTPVGSYPLINDEVFFPYEHLSEEHLVIDLIYNPSKTIFLEKSENNGAQILNGSSMLREQAMKSWQIWNQKN